MARILLIEDDDDLRWALSAVLAKHGHLIVDVAGGDDAIQRFDDAEPDVVITDVMMENGNGFEALLKVLDLKRDLPVIVMSGDEGYLKDASRIGATHTLLKPFDVDALMTTIDELAEGAGIVGQRAAAFR